MRDANVERALRLGEHCRKIGSGATPRGGKEAYLDEGPFSLIRSQNILNERFSFGGLAFISQAQADQLANVEVLAGDVLLNITGDSVARVCQVDPAVLPARVNQHVAIIRPDPEAIDSRFLRYFLVSPDMQAHMLGLAASGATRNALTKGMIEKFEVPAVPLPEQRAIAATLGALDDKIELNRRMNETLEAMARALFRDWFVDFGPTRAKMAGEVPYLSPNLWSLFPDSLDDAGKPVGWEESTIGNVLERLKVGKLYNKKSALDIGMVPILDQGKSGEIGFHNNEPNIRACAEDRVCSFANHTCVLRLIDFDFSTIQNVIPFRGKNYPTEWVYYASQGKQQFEEYRGHWPSFIEHTIIAPPLKFAEAFYAEVASMIARMSHNELESRTLAQTRDLLLPRLMSGELRVAEAARAVEAVL